MIVCLCANVSERELVATIKAAIPIGDLIPALTLAWFAARYFKLGRPHDPHLIETHQIAPGSYAPRPPRG